MRIDGLWHLSDDGMVRPVIHAEIRAADGQWVKAPFLVDTGADRTVLSADVWLASALKPVETPDRLSGVGGTANSVVVETQLRATQSDGNKVAFKGQFACFTDSDAVDTCVLGRDILNLFALIVDREHDTICLIGQQHKYKISDDPFKQ